MTTPTQAQIEAVALLLRVLALAKTGHWRDRTGLSLEAHPIIDDIRALTAAAEVGEPLIEQAMKQSNENMQWWRGFNTAIERCAQVAETTDWEAFGSKSIGMRAKIAAAIRKLKDET